MPRSPEIKKEKLRKKRKLDLVKAVYASDKSIVTGYYGNKEPKSPIIKPILHSIKLSGKIFHQEIEDSFGKLSNDERYYRLKRKNYKYKFNITVDNFRITILSIPLKPKRPQSIIQIIPPEGISNKEYKLFLINKIYNSFPNINVSEIEYTTDIFFADSSGAEELFDVLIRNVFIPKQSIRKTPRIFPESKELWKIRNRTIRIGRHKIYERGTDKNRKNRGWNRKDIDRVRMESTISRQKLKNTGVNTIADLIRSPRFFDIIKDIWHFKNFKDTRSKNLPGELDPYTYSELFQREHFEARNSGVKNLDRFVVDAKGLKWFKEDLLNAMKYFDLKW